MSAMQLKRIKNYTFSKVLVRIYAGLKLFLGHEHRVYALPAIG